APKVGMRIKWVPHGYGAFPRNYYLDDRWIGLAPSYFISYIRVPDDRPEADVDRPGADIDRPGRGFGRPGRGTEKYEPVYEPLYKPVDPIWEKAGIAAPDPNVPEPEIEVCGTGPNGYCRLVANPAMAEYMKNNPSYDQLN